MCSLRLYFLVEVLGQLHIVLYKKCTLINCILIVTMEIHLIKMLTILYLLNTFQGVFYLYFKKMYWVCLILKTKTDLEWTDLTGISGLHRCLYFLHRFRKAQTVVCMYSIQAYLNYLNDYRYFSPQYPNKFIDLRPSPIPIIHLFFERSRAGQLV